MAATALIYYGLLLILFCAVGAAVEQYLVWRSRDRYRRLERLVHRNLFRISGGTR